MPTRLSLPIVARSVPLAAALAGLLIGSSTMDASADEPLLISTQRLSLGTARRVADATIAACRAQGIQIGVTVVDRDGVVQVQLRDSIAAPITVPISFKKAYTAVNFNAATSAMADRADTPVGRQEFLLMSAGGITIQAGGALVGGVGVSGAPDGATDEACARAGVEAIQDDLDLGG